MVSLNSVGFFKAAIPIQCTVILVLLLCPKFEAAEECNFIKCILSSRFFISDLRKNDSKFNCSKFINISGCSDYCMHKYYPSIRSYSDTKSHSIEQFCIQSIASHSNVSWSCIARHAFSLLTCLANVSTLISNSVHEDGIIKESCRKTLEYSGCASKVLLPVCGKKSVEVVKDIIQFGIDYFKPLSCKDTSIEYVLEMPVNYYIPQDFMEVAQCFDNRLIQIDACFLQMIQNERDLHDFLCGYHDKEDDVFGKCVQYQVEKHCKLTSSARTLLLKLFSFGGLTCKQPIFMFQHLATPHSLETDYFTDAKKDVDNQQLPLNDEVHSPGSFETVTFKVTKTIELFHNKNGTSDTAEDSLVKNYAKNSSHKVIDHFAASKGINLFWDKMIYCTVFLFTILEFLIQLLE